MQVEGIADFELAFVLGIILVSKQVHICLKDREDVTWDIGHAELARHDRIAVDGLNDGPPVGGIDGGNCAHLASHCPKGRSCKHLNRYERTLPRRGGA